MPDSTQRTGDNGEKKRNTYVKLHNNGQNFNVKHIHSHALVADKVN